jgi:hypothetical protein
MLPFFEGTGNKNDVTVTFFIWSVTVITFST